MHRRPLALLAGIPAVPLSAMKGLIDLGETFLYRVFGDTSREGSSEDAC